MPPKKSATSKKSRGSSAAAAAGNKKLTKSQYFTELSQASGLTKKDIEKVFEAIERVTAVELRRAGQVDIVPGVVNLKKKLKPARPARMGTNPRTGQPMQLKAKPAETVVKCYMRTKGKAMA